MANNPLTEYMKKVESRLNEEQQRCQFYIHRVTEPKLLKQVEKVRNTLDNPTETLFRF